MIQESGLKCQQPPSFVVLNLQSSIEAPLDNSGVSMFSLVMHDYASY